MQASPVVKALAGIGLPLLVIVAWALFFAPRAEHRLDMPWILIGKLIVFGGAALCLYKATQPGLGLIMGATVVVHSLLTVIWNQK